MRRFIPSLLFLAVALSGAFPVHAQDAAVPPAEQRRIVKGRPRLYTLKRGLHPLTWLEGATQPIFRSVASGRLRRSNTGPSSRPVRLGLAGTGPGTGFGPRITPFIDNLFGTGLRIEAPLTFTYLHYENYQLLASMPLQPRTATHQLDLAFRAGYDSRPSVNFFGIGNESAREPEASYRSISREVAIGVETKFGKGWSASALTGLRNVGVTHSRSTPAAQQVSWDHEVPGLFTGANFHSTVLAVTHSTKDNEHIASRGGLQAVQIGLHEGIQQGDFSYWQYRLDLQQFFTLNEEGRSVIALRARLETNQEKGGSEIPFFDLAAIGDADTVRGFSNYRFRDKSAVNASVEYRYRVGPAFDWAIFLDAGQVAPEPGDFRWGKFHAGYGVRFIVRASETGSVSIDVGRSNEAVRLYLNVSPAF